MRHPPAQPSWLCMLVLADALCAEDDSDDEEQSRKGDRWFHRVIQCAHSLGDGALNDLAAALTAITRLEPHDDLEPVFIDHAVTRGVFNDVILRLSEAAIADLSGGYLANAIIAARKRAS